MSKGKIGLLGDISCAELGGTKPLDDLALGLGLYTKDGIGDLRARQARYVQTLAEDEDPPYEQTVGPWLIFGK